MQDWKKSGLAALLLIIVLAGGIFASEPEEEASLALPEQAAKVEERPAHQAIMGSEQAAASEGLKDPFTLTHETRAERSKAEEGKKPAVPRGGQETRPAALPAPPPVPASKVPTVQEPKLTGIISGASGQLALVEYGDKSLTLAAGEGAGGLTVTAIEARRVLVSTPQGEKWLELP